MLDVYFKISHESFLEKIYQVLKAVTSFTLRLVCNHNILLIKFYD